MLYVFLLLSQSFLDFMFVFLWLGFFGGFWYQVCFFLGGVVVVGFFCSFVDFWLFCLWSVWFFWLKILCDYLTCCIMLIVFCSPGKAGIQIFCWSTWVQFRKAVLYTKVHHIHNPSRKKEHNLPPCTVVVWSSLWSSWSNQRWWFCPLIEWGRNLLCVSIYSSPWLVCMRQAAFSVLKDLA